MSLHNLKAGRITATSNGTGDLFLEDIGPATKVELDRGNTWIRQLNREIVGGANFGGNVWILGDNVEGKGNDVPEWRYPRQESFVTTNGGSTEVLGGAIDAVRYDGVGRVAEPLYSAITHPWSTGISRMSVVAASYEIPAIQ